MQLLFCVCSATAAAAPVSLVYEHPANAGCPDESELRRLVAARLGTDPFVANAAAQVAVRIQSQEHQLQAEVVLENPVGTPRGKKVLTTKGPCVALASSVAMTVALIVDPVIKRVEQVPVVVEIETEPIKSATQSLPVPASAPSTQWQLAAGISGDAGLSLGLQPTMRLEGRARWSLVSMGLEGRIGWPVSAALTQGRLRTSAFLAALVPCLHWWWLRGCADVTLGAMRLEGLDLIDARTSTVFQALVGLRMVLAIPIARWLQLAAMVSGTAALTRPSVIVGDSKVWTVPALGGGFGAWVIFPL